MYAKIIDNTLIKYPYSLADMRAEYPNIEIADEPTDAQLAACNAKRAIRGPAPTQSSRTHTFSMAFSDNDDGSVTIIFVSHELDRRLAEFNMRDARDAALTRCDWVITRAFEEGTPVPPAYLTYRQELRNLPEQEGFPYEYVWPAEPSRA
jgi:hypothetical protein